MPQRKRSLIKWREDRGSWCCDFYVNGRRFRDGLGPDKGKAETAAAQIYAAALAAPAAKGAKAAPPAHEATLTLALGEYWRIRGQHKVSRDDIARHSKVLLAELGADTPLEALSQKVLEDYVARRRVRQVRQGAKRGEMLDRANASINRETGHLRTVLIAAGEWGWPVPTINWKRVRLLEPDRRQTILSEEQEARFRAELRADYWPLIGFALISGARLENCIELRWDQIDWQARTITLRGKSERPGGKLMVLPLTDALAALLRTLEGHHPDLVFTYVCARNRHDPHRGVVQIKGCRYPFTRHGWRKDWDRARRAIGLPELRFHDLRHTAAVRTLAAPGGNLVTVQMMLGHASVSTTARYATSDVERLRAAMEAAQRARVLVTNLDTKPKTGDQTGD